MCEWLHHKRTKLMLLRSLTAVACVKRCKAGRGPCCLSALLLITYHNFCGREKNGGKKGLLTTLGLGGDNPDGRYVQSVVKPLCTRAQLSSTVGPRGTKTYVLQGVVFRKDGSEVSRTATTSHGAAKVVPKNVRAQRAMRDRRVMAEKSSET